MVQVTARILAIVGILTLQAYAVPVSKHSIESSSSLSFEVPTVASNSSIIAEVQLQRLAEIARGIALSRVTHASGQHEKCTQQTIRVRRDWRAFTRKEKKAYINSVLCLRELPSITPPDLAPGAKSRYDDFVVTHINQTQIIHYTVCLSCKICYRF